MLTRDFDFPRPVSPRSIMAILPTLSSNTTGAEASGVFILDRPMHFPFAFANNAFHALSLDANAVLKDVAATIDAKAALKNIRILSELNMPCLPANLGSTMALHHRKAVSGGRIVMGRRATPSRKGKVTLVASLVTFGRRRTTLVVRRAGRNAECSTCRSESANSCAGNLVKNSQRGSKHSRRQALAPPAPS